MYIHSNNCVREPETSLQSRDSHPGELLTQRHFRKTAMFLTNQIKLFVILVLLTGMIFYTFNSVRKFQEHKIAVHVQRDNSEDELLFPSITICSGFRDEGMTPERIVDNAIANGQENSDQLNMTGIEQLTFSRQEVLTRFVQGVDNVWDADLIPLNDLWTTEVHEYYGGRCHTFNPKKKTKPGETNSLQIALRNPPRGYHNCHNDDKSECHKYLPVFLHARGAFIYNKGHKFIGRSMLYPEPNRNVQYKVYRKEIRKLNHDNEPCDHDIDIVEWKQCLDKAYDRIAGCKLPWETSGERGTCNMTQIHQRFTSKERHLWWDIDGVAITTTGPPCKHLHFPVERVLNEYEGLPRHFLSHDTVYMLQLFYVETVTEITEEFEAFDMFSLIGEMGGALGLFLGLSCLHMILQAIDFVIGYCGDGKIRKKDGLQKNKVVRG